MLDPHRAILFAAAFAFGCSPIQQADLDSGDDGDTSGTGNLTGLPPMTTAPPADTSDPDDGTTGTSGSGSTDMGADASATDTSGDMGTTSSTTDDPETSTGTSTDTGDMLLPCADVNAGSAIPVSLTGSTERATDDFEPSCSDGDDNDVVVQFTAPSDGIYELNTLGSDFDTVLSVRDGCDGEELACDDDISSTGGVLVSRLGLQLDEGETVLAIVDGFNMAGEFELSIDLHDPDSAAGTVGFGDCINEAPETACPGDEFCVGTMSGTEAVCAYPCNEASDCPDQPAGGNASSTCEDITGDGIPECQIDCGGSETCPDGMFCFSDNLCVWPQQ